MKRPTQTLPDPWLFDSEKLLRELDRCRELVLNVPINDAQATHFALNIAIDAVSNLEQHLPYLLHLHREGQRAIRRQQEQFTFRSAFPKRPQSTTTTSYAYKRRRRAAATIALRQPESHLQSAGVPNLLRPSAWQYGLHSGNIYVPKYYMRAY